MHKTAAETCIIHIGIIAASYAHPMGVLIMLKVTRASRPVTVLSRYEKQCSSGALQRLCRGSFCGIMGGLSITLRVNATRPSTAIGGLRLFIILVPNLCKKRPADLNGRGWYGPGYGAPEVSTGVGRNLIILNIRTKWFIHLSPMKRVLPN